MLQDSCGIAQTAEFILDSAFRGTQADNSTALPVTGKLRLSTGNGSSTAGEVLMLQEVHAFI